MEQLGWAIMWATAGGLLFAAAGPLFTPQLDALSRDFWALLVPAGFLFWFAMRLISPRPPEKPLANEPRLERPT